MSVENKFDEFVRTHQQAPEEAKKNAKSNFTKEVAKVAGHGIALYVGMSVTVALGHLAVRKARAALGLGNTITVTIRTED